MFSLAHYVSLMVVSPIITYVNRFLSVFGNICQYFQVVIGYALTFFPNFQWRL